MIKNRIRLTESQLHKVIKESVKRVLSESSDSVAPQPFGNDDYMDYVEPNDSFFKKHHPWRNNPDCKSLEGLIEWGYACAKDFADGKYSIINYLSDLYRMV